MSTTDEEAAMPPWHKQSMPVPSWLVVAALAFLGPGDAMVASAWSGPDYTDLGQQVEELTERVEALSEQVEALHSTDGEVANVLAEVVRARDERRTE